MKIIADLELCKDVEVKKFSNPIWSTYSSFIICLFITLGIFSFGYTQASVSSDEIRCVSKINEERKKYGLHSLKIWHDLSNCAREHSRNMGLEKVPFGHQDFEKRAKAIQKICQLHSFGENVAYSFNCKDPVQTAVEGWMKSPSHKKNILGDFEETGIGIFINKEGKFFITQLFARKYVY